MPNIPGVPLAHAPPQLADGQIKLQDGFLTNFGRPARESVCECERSNDVNLGPVMALMSGPTVGDAISDPENAIAKLTSEIQDDRKLVEEIFLRILNRHAERERNSGGAGLHAGAWMQTTKRCRRAGRQKETKQKPVIAKAEQERLAAIDAAKKELEAYKAKMAPEIAKKEAARKAATIAAEAKVKAVQDTAAANQPAWENYLDLTTEWEPFDNIKVQSCRGRGETGEAAGWQPLCHRTARRPRSRRQLHAHW